MELARTTTRQGRRRRVVAEESATSLPMRRPRRRRRDDRYALVLQADGALPVGHFLPYSSAAIAVSLLLGMLVAWSVGAGDLFRPAIEKQLGMPIPWLDLRGSASLAAWIQSASLWLCATLALFIYQLRQHRIDDYRGRYRIWIWMTSLWGFASFDAIVGIHETCGEWVVRYVIRDAVPSWAGIGLIYGLCGLPLGIRLLREVWECPAARSMLLASAVWYAVALLPGLIPWMEQQASPWPLVALAQGATLCGNWFLWTTCALFARHVRREMEGRLHPRDADGEEAAGDDATTDVLSLEEAAPRVAVAKKLSVAAGKTNSSPATDTSPATGKGEGAEATVPRRRWWSWLSWKAPQAEGDKLPSPGRKRRAPRAEPADAAPAAEAAEKVAETAPRSVAPTVGGVAAAAGNKGTDRGEASTIPMPATAPTSRSGESGDDDEDDAGDLGHLSKAERKKLRREQRKLRNAA